MVTKIGFYSYVKAFTYEESLDTIQGLNKEGYTELISFQQVAIGDDIFWIVILKKHKLGKSDIRNNL